MTFFGKLETEVEIKTSAHIFHDVFSCRPHHISNMSPSTIKGVDLHEGDWGKEGTVTCWSYFHDGEEKIAKAIIEAIDDKNLSTTFKVIEGDVLKLYKSFRTIVKATPKHGGTLVHWTFEYEKLNEDVPDPHTLLEFAVRCSNDIDDHHVKEGKA